MVMWHSGCMKFLLAAILVIGGLLYAALLSSVKDPLPPEQIEIDDEMGEDGHE